MRSLTRTLARGEAGGKALPNPLRALRELQVDIRASEITMIAAAPGMGKSSLALYLAMQTGVRTLYVCADTTAFTMTLRIVAMLTGRTQQEIERRIAQPDGHEWAKQILAAAGHVIWSFDSAPSLSDIDAEVQAFEEVLGTNPDLIVIDNLTDITDESGSGDEFGTLRSVMKELKFLARDTGAAVLLLHHTSEAFKYDVAPPRAALHGKVAQIPAVILTLHTNSETTAMSIAAVKNRYGAADPTGNQARNVWFDAARMSIQDIDR